MIREPKGSIIELLTLEVNDCRVRDYASDQPENGLCSQGYAGAGKTGGRDQDIFKPDPG